MALGTPVAAAAAYNATAGGTTVSPAYPSGILATDIVLLFVGQKPSTANGGTVTTPSGWTLREELNGAGGYGATLGADTGNTNLRVYSWNSPVAGQTGNLTVTIGDNNISWAFMVRVPTGGGTVSYGSADGSRTTAPTVNVAFSVALTNGTSATNFQTGDRALWAMCIPTDVTTPGQFSAQSITATGATFGTATEFNEPDSGTGNDIGGYSAWAAVTAGSSTTAPTVTVTPTGTVTNVRGPIVLLRLREAAPPPQLNAESASFSLTGSAATTTATRHLVASPASYALTGQAATTSYNRLLSADAGSYSLTGSQALLAASKALTAASGSYSLTGFDVTFIVVAAAGMDLQPESFSITGAQASLAYKRQFNAEVGSYTLTGSDVNLNLGVTLVASPANYTSAEYVDLGYVDPGYVGNDNPPASLIATRKLNLESGSFNVTGSAATLSYMKMLSASSGSYNITGAPARLAYPYWPLPSQVVLGVAYGPNGDDYIGTYVDLGIKVDIGTGALIKPLSSKTAITL